VERIMTARRTIEQLPTFEQIAEFLAYDPDSGDLIWIKQPARSGKSAPGKIAGKISIDGYRVVGLFKDSFLAHRIAYLLMTGEWCRFDLDHQDADKLNNRWSNLRPATGSQNLANMANSTRNTSGAKGVHKLKSTGKYQVRARGQFFGTYDTLEEARAVYRAAAEAIWGEFARFDWLTA
jgi:hypothetical protein